MDLYELAALNKANELRRSIDKVPRLIGSVDPLTGLTLLQWAALGKAHDTAKLLLQRNADPNAGDSPAVGRPLIIAISRGDRVIVERLLRFGADKNRFHPGRGTRRAIALAQKQLEIAELLK